MNDAINAILKNIGDNPEAMKALLAAISMTDEISKNEPEVKINCRHIICLERTTVDGDKVYHPFVTTPITCENPKMLILDNSIDAQDEAQRLGMFIHDNVYALPATEEQIDELYRLLKALNNSITTKVRTAAAAVGSLSYNVDIEQLCDQFLRNMLDNCGNVIGASMTKDSTIIDHDVELAQPVLNDHDNVSPDEEDWDNDDVCGDCDCGCCPNHPDNW
jgi:hypothetical protein